MSNAFNADYGTTQGRIETPLGPVFELGSSVPVTRYVAAGDSNTISQTTTSKPDGSNAIRFHVRTRAPSSLPSGFTWRLDVMLDGNVYTSRTLNHTQDYLDGSINLLNSPVVGATDLQFQLTLTGPSSGPQPIELPGCAIALVVDDTVGATIEVTNRVPERGGFGVAVGGPFSFDIESTSPNPFGSIINKPSTTIWLDDEPVFTANAFTANWSGSSFGLSPSGGGRVVLIPSQPIESDREHTIRVSTGIIGAPAGSTGTLVSEWTFNTEDLVVPALVSATPIGPREVRLLFSEPVTTTVTDYTLALLAGAPAVTPSVVSVRATADPTVYVLRLSASLTPWGAYRVSALNVVDLSGNQIVVPSFADFTGYQCPAPATRSFDPFEFFPEINREEDTTGDLRAFASVLDDVSRLLLCYADQTLATLVDVDTAPEPTLDMMLHDLGNPFTFPMTTSEKVRLVRLMPIIRRQKGTGPGIVNVIRLFLGLEVTLNVFAWPVVGIGTALVGIDWTLGSSDFQDRLTFEVIVPRVLTNAERAKVLAIVRYMKDSREFFVLVEPVPPMVVDHWQLGFSELGVETVLH